MDFSRDRLVFRAALRFALNLIEIHMKKNDWQGLLHELSKVIEKQDQEIDAIVVSALIK